MGSRLGTSNWCLSPAGSQGSGAVEGGVLSGTGGGQGCLYAQLRAAGGRERSAGGVDAAPQSTGRAGEGFVRLWRVKWTLWALGSLVRSMAGRDAAWAEGRGRGRAGFGRAVEEQQWSGSGRAAQHTAGEVRWAAAARRRCGRQLKREMGGIVKGPSAGRRSERESLAGVPSVEQRRRIRLFDANRTSAGRESRAANGKRNETAAARAAHGSARQQRQRGARPGEGRVTYAGGTEGGVRRTRPDRRWVQHRAGDERAMYVLGLYGVQQVQHHAETR
jgi:hypothetical protein